MTANDLITKLDLLTHPEGGFDFADFAMANRLDLIKQFPNHTNIIEQMTR